MTNPEQGWPSGPNGEPTPGADPYGSYPVQPGQQPPPTGYGPPPNQVPGWNPAMPINNNLGWAIGAIIACWPFGIPSLIKALNVNTLWAQGRPDLAQQSADEAKKWGKIGVIVAASLIGVYMLLLIAYFIFIFAVIGAGAAGS